MPENYSLYIGDSLFRNLDHEKMSSSSQAAKVFSFPGAMPANIKSKLLSDSRFNELDPSKVSNIFIFCGANCVDRVIRVPFSAKSAWVSDQYYYSHNQELQKAKTELNSLIDFLHNWSSLSSIKFVNILPRESSARNYVINSLNYFVESLSNERPFLRILSSELERNLFTYRNGHRKSNYFLEGEDNVHLNRLGTVRLAKHLKYVAHH